MGLQVSKLRQRTMSHGVTTLHKIRTYHSFFVDHSDIVGLGYPRRMHSRAPSHTTGVRGYHVSTHSGRILVWERTSVQSSHTTGVCRYHVSTHSGRILVWERTSVQSSHTTGVCRYHVSTHSGRILVWERTSVQSSHTTGLREYHVYIPFQSFLAIMVNMVTLGVWVRFW